MLKPAPNSHLHHQVPEFSNEISSVKVEQYILTETQHQPLQAGFYLINFLKPLSNKIPYLTLSFEKKRVSNLRPRGYGLKRQPNG
jgi:hypothetical protein